MIVGGQGSWLVRGDVSNDNGSAGNEPVARIGYRSFDTSDNFGLLGRGGCGDLRREESPHNERCREEPPQSCEESARDHG